MFESSMLGDPRIQKDYTGWWRNTPSCQRRSQLEKVESEVMFWNFFRGIIPGELTHSKKKIGFGSASLVDGPNHPVLCVRLPAWYVMSGGEGLESRPGFNLAWTHTCSCHSPVWYHRVLARVSGWGMLSGSRERGKVGSPACSRDCFS